MAIDRWRPRRETTRQEDVLLRRLGRTRKLFAFLRVYRCDLFSDEFQAELETMYRPTGAGKEPVVPALLAMALLLQGYLGVSDAEAVELTVVDLRWQMVLDRLGADRPAFSQGALQEFRERLIAADMDRRLLERTIEFARTTKAFDWKKLPKDLRVAVDSAPLDGAGKVEDTINLLGHAARKVVECAAALLGSTAAHVAKDAEIPALLAPSVKKGLDQQWGTSEARDAALRTLLEQIDNLETWLMANLSAELKRPPMKEHLETLHQIRDQDLEPDPSGGGIHIRDGVAPDRRISISDREMRHGRKTKSKRIDGFKRHIATDLDTNLVIACAVTPANQPEQEALALMQPDITRHKRSIAEAHLDRGYVASPVVAQIARDGATVVCKPWAQPANGFTKADFKFDLRRRIITCPAGETKPFVPGATVSFDSATCATCELRPACTANTSGRGRQVHIADDEILQERLRRAASSKTGRAQLRERVAIEHSLAHVARRQGRRARYRGARRNLYDTRRASAVTNMETVQRRLEAKAA
jgi:hypothetical protein